MARKNYGVPGAFGNKGNNASNNGKKQERREFFPFMVNGVINIPLESLRNQEGVVNIGPRSTTLASKLERKGENIVATVINSVVAKVHYFGIRVAEYVDVKGMTATVACTPGGKQLPEKCMAIRQGKPYRDRNGQICYQGLSHAAIVTAKGQFGKCFVNVIGFKKGSKTDTSIEIEETRHSLDWPDELVGRFYLDESEDYIPSQSEVEHYIREHLARKGEARREALWPYISVMALCYRKCCGETVIGEDGEEYSLSMLDMEPTKEPETDQSDEPAATVDIAGMQAAEAAEDKQPKKKKKSRKKTGTDK